MPYVRKRKTGWQAIWYLPNGKRRTETRRWTKGEALTYARQREDDAARRPWASSSGRIPTFSEYVESSVKSRAVASSTLVKERSMWRRIEPTFGDWPLNAISPSDIRGFVDGLITARLSAAYIRDVYGLTKMAFDFAVADEVLSQSPCVRVKLPKRTKRIVAADMEEVRALARHMDDRYRALVLLLAGTGLRISEALALQVRDLIEIPRPAIRITKAITDGRIGPPKTRAGEREVTLPPWLVPSLQRHVVERELGVDDWLFPAPQGGLLDHRRFRSRFWKPAAKRAGVSLTPHQLRHLQASLLIDAGTPLPEIAYRLGHENPQVTMNTYAHWLRTDDSGSADVIPDMARLTVPSHGR